MSCRAVSLHWGKWIFLILWILARFLESERMCLFPYTVVNAQEICNSSSWCIETNLNLRTIVLRSLLFISANQRVNYFFYTFL